MRKTPPPLPPKPPKVSAAAPAPVAELHITATQYHHFNDPSSPEFEAIKAKIAAFDKAPADIQKTIKKFASTIIQKTLELSKAAEITADHTVDQASAGNSFLTKTLNKVAELLKDNSTKYEYVAPPEATAAIIVISWQTYDYFLSQIGSQAFNNSDALEGNFKSG